MPFMNEEITNKAIVRFWQSKHEIFCQRILSLQPSGLMLVKGWRRTFQITIKQIFIEWFSSKTKIGKNSWCFNNSLLSKPDFSSATKRLLSSLKTKTAITPQQVIGGNILNLTWNKVAITFSKNANTEENIRISRLQKRLRNFYRK